MAKWALVVFGCAAGVVAQAAETLKGIDVARACRSAKTEDLALCRGFLDGFTYGSQMNVGAEFIGQWRYGEQTWCFPRDITDQQVKDALLAHAQANTGTLHFPAAVVVANAMAEKFPCK
jgi:hypothetical protein